MPGASGVEHRVPGSPNDIAPTSPARPSTGISVIIASFKVRDLLARCLATVTDADEVLVVDNASQDGTRELVRLDFPKVRLIANDANVGFGAAVNQAARLAAGDFLLMLNPDTELPKGALQAMRREMDIRPEAAVIGFRQVDANGEFQLAIGPRPSFVLELARMIVQHRLDGGDARLAAWLDRCLGRPRSVSWVSGAALLVRASAFRLIGGFDESFFLYFEDADFCLRARAQGEVWYVPDVTVIHHRGRSALLNRSVANRAYRDSQRKYWRRYRGSWSATAIEAYQGLRTTLGSHGR